MVNKVRVFDPDGTDRGEIPFAQVDYTVKLGAVPTDATLTVVSWPRLSNEPDLLDVGKVVEVTDGAAVTTWLIDSIPRRSYVSDRNPTAAPHVRSLVGGAGVLARAAVHAENGMSEEASHLRPFGPARAGYDDSGWVEPVSGGTQADPNYEPRGRWPDQWPESASAGNAEYIHSVNDMTEPAAAGRAPLRTEFTLTERTELTVSLTVDNELRDPLWIAGRQPFDPITGLTQFVRTFTSTFVVPAGTHAVYALVNQLDAPGVLNVAHLLLHAVDQNGDTVLQTNTTDWKAWPVYPAVILPGDNFGIIVGILFGEGQDRDAIPATAFLGFDHDTDSGDVAWAHETSRAWDVAVTTVLAVAMDLVTQLQVDHLDAAMTDAGLRIDAWQTYGVDRTVGDAPVRFDTGRDVVEADEETAPLPVNDMWVLTRSGWIRFHDDDAIADHGVVEGGDVIGSASSPEAIVGAEAEVLHDVGQPDRYQLTVIDGRHRFGADWYLGDIVEIPAPGGGHIPVRVLEATRRATQQGQTVMLCETAPA